MDTSKIFLLQIHVFNSTDDEIHEEPRNNTIDEAEEPQSNIDLPEQTANGFNSPLTLTIGDGDSDDESDEDEALMRTGRLFGGLVKDVKRKLPWVWSDFKDALAPQTLASIIYIYLATVTKAITFGGFLGDITDKKQGVLEAFLGHALAGGAFCLLGGQPLTVLGCTGPVLIFEGILVSMCSPDAYDVDYMTFRLWIGLW